MSDAEISRAGINIVSVVAQKLLPHPWDYLAAVAVMLSTIGTVETSILQLTRTLFSMSRDKALRPRYGRLQPVYRTPLVATLLVTGLGLVLLFGSSYLHGIKTVIDEIQARLLTIPARYADQVARTVGCDLLTARRILERFAYKLSVELEGLEDQARAAVDRLQ